MTIELPLVDVRRKRPPVLAFLLRLETLRRALRVISLLAIDFFGVFAAIYVALMVKAVAALRRLGVARLVRGDARERRVRLAGHGAAVRALRAVLVARRAARLGADRLVAVPGDGRRAGVRGRERRAVLELLHLLRHAGRSRSASSACCGGATRAPPGSCCGRRATAAGRCSSAPASTSRTSRTRWSARCTRRSRWSASSRSRRGPTTGCARSAGSRTCRRCWTPTASRRSSSPTRTSRRSARSSSSTSATVAA